MNIKGKSVFYLLIVNKEKKKCFYCMKKKKYKKKFPGLKYKKMEIQNTKVIIAISLSK